MRILAIETSCDETAIAIVEAEGAPETGVSFSALANIVHSQVELHAEYGGVFPTLAKREHGRNLVPVLEKTLREAGKQVSGSRFQFPEGKIQVILEREAELADALIDFLKQNTEIPPIDAVAVTHGPGLEPALWVGINFAKTLVEAWGVPLIPVNHMEGHFVSALLQAETKNSKSETLNPKQIQNSKFQIQNIQFPIIALLVSGGHTELVLSRDWLQYEIIGETRDDAAGEAFDKVARVLGLPYPGGPAISREAGKWRGKPALTLPRPMIDSDDFDFSFSGLKTAVRYRAEQIAAASPEGALDKETVRVFAYEFQEAAVDVLTTKTMKAAHRYGAKTILLGGGVAANKRLQEVLAKKVARSMHDSCFMIPDSILTGDNALMIAVAAYLRHTLTPREYNPENIRAKGTLRLAP